MRPTINAIVIFLVLVLSSITPAIAQMLDKSPVIAAVERASTGEILIRAIVVGECVGTYKVSTTIGPNVLDLSGMKEGQTRLFRTGWYGMPGEYTINLVEVEAMPTTACPYFPVGRFRLDSLVFFIRQDYKLDNTRRLAGMHVTDEGKTFVNFNGEYLSFGFRFVGPRQTQMYVYQVFPNGTVSIETDLVAANSVDYSAPRFSMRSMFGDKPIYFVASSGGVSTSGPIYTP